MDYGYTQQGELNRNYGLDVDQHIKDRDAAKIKLSQARMGLLNMGVQVVQGENLFVNPTMNLKKFFASQNQEFSWEVEYENGDILRQFEGKEQHHYGNIDQKRLKEIRWVSLFDFETSNEERRVIATLNFKTGVFTFLNGFVPQDVRGQTYQEYPSGLKPKLILKMVKRTSTSVGFVDGSVEEIAYYNRYILGWENLKESETIAKKVICIEPNGFIHLWDMD